MGHLIFVICKSCRRIAINSLQKVKWVRYKICEFKFIWIDVFPPSDCNQNQIEIHAIWLGESVRTIIRSVDAHPVCEHGPALLFEHLVAKNRQQFYACSAYRDQKECPLYINVDPTQAKTYNRSLLLKNAAKSQKLAIEKSHLLQKVKSYRKKLAWISTRFSIGQILMGPLRFRF